MGEFLLWRGTETTGSIADYNLQTGNCPRVVWITTLTDLHLGLEAVSCHCVELSLKSEWKAVCDWSTSLMSPFCALVDPLQWATALASLRWLSLVSLARKTSAMSTCVVSKAVNRCPTTVQCHTRHSCFCRSKVSRVIWHQFVSSGAFIHTLHSNRQIYKEQSLNTQEASY